MVLVCGIGYVLKIQDCERALAGSGGALLRTDLEIEGVEDQEKKSKNDEN